MTSGPIVIVDADSRFRQLYSDVINAIGVYNETRFFENGQELLDYLHSTKEKPFIILSEVNLDGMSGLQMKEAIQNDDYLRNRAIPFVFISTNVGAESVAKAHRLQVQGYFEKPREGVYVEQMMLRIFEYWELCKHINNT